MDDRRHGQEGALAPSENVAKYFCALVVTAKRSVDELFMQYFHNLSSAHYEGFAPRGPDPYRGSIPGRGTFVPRPLICQPLEKIMTGTGLIHSV